MPDITRSAQAKEDTRNILLYLAERSGSQRVSDNFALQMDERIQQYARQPQMGTVYDELLPDLRYFTFKNQYIIFYQETSSGIEIIRVLHGARDIDLTDFV